MDILFKKKFIYSMTIWPYDTFLVSYEASGRGAHVYVHWSTADSFFVERNVIFLKVNLAPDISYLRCEYSTHLGRVTAALDSFLKL